MLLPEPDGPVTPINCPGLILSDRLASTSGASWW
ncbi:Uncharacterised protein [Vibrio cholerae]|nr:Uncharacterised protein [Vibrio cholerae]